MESAKYTTLFAEAEEYDRTFTGPCNVVSRVGHIVSAAHQQALKAQKDSVALHRIVLDSPSVKRAGSAQKSAGVLYGISRFFSSHSPRNLFQLRL